MGRFAAHLVLLRRGANKSGEEASSSSCESAEQHLQILLQKRSRKVLQGLTYGFFGGSLHLDETILSCDETQPAEVRCAARLRAALREAAEEGGAGRGPELSAVLLPELAGVNRTLPAEKVPGARLPSTVVQLLSQAELPPMVTCKVGEYMHYFVFHLMEGVVAEEWIPRAQAKHRWEVEEEASETHFGYRWVTLTDWGPALGGGQLCSWVKALFHHERRRADFLSAVELLTGHCLVSQENKSVKYTRRSESMERAPPVPPPRPDRTEKPQKPPEKLADDLQAWLAQILHGFAHMPFHGNNRRDELAASLSCRWVVDCQEVAAVEPRETYKQLMPNSDSADAFLCFHGTSKVSCQQIAVSGFDPSRRSPSLGKIVPYLIGEYLTSDPTVALKYSRQKEIHNDTLSILVVQVPNQNFEMRNGVWFQHKFKEDGEGSSKLPGVDFAQSTTMVCEDERALLPRAILTFRPSKCITKTSSAMATYDVGVAPQGKSSHNWRRFEAALPKAVLFDLDMTCWPYTLGSESFGPPYTPMLKEVGATDSRGRPLRVCRDIPEIFRTLHKAEIPIVLCSRSSVPNWCMDFLQNCPLNPKVDDTKVSDVISEASVIRPAIKKIGHFREIRQHFDVPFHQLLFFDDDQRNCEDGRRLGIRCMRVPRNGWGVTMEVFSEGMRMFSAAAPSLAPEQAAASSSALSATAPSFGTASNLASSASRNESESVADTSHRKASRNEAKPSPLSTPRMKSGEPQGPSGSPMKGLDANCADSKDSNYKDSLQTVPRPLWARTSPS